MLELSPPPQPAQWRWCACNEWMIPGGYAATDWCSSVEVSAVVADTLNAWQVLALDGGAEVRPATRCLRLRVVGSDEESEFDRIAFANATRVHWRRYELDQLERGSRVADELWPYQDLSPSWPPK